MDDINPRSNKLKSGLFEGCKSIFNVGAYSRAAKISSSAPMLEKDALSC